ncbi:MULTISPECIES: CHAT domain-containing protein [unclassified Sphingopyxis]|uniref:CHAT domain-containing protein n=1 Tax=unclassified Sphingopyxis TaxID=2614943 RepID=UPI000736FD6D|nr:MULTISPECIES: CHAT domain-containing protein [unclassified Sphingopyxis]KTE42932.1 hypothetical protein ATE62_04250 [Sphingopyxis sp. HIX]KTE85242.1 hypothetical protein ATE72_05115 [Sphingopyxis sp. HXXIV]
MFIAKSAKLYSEFSELVFQFGGPDSRIGIFPKIKRWLPFQSSVSTTSDDSTIVDDASIDRANQDLLALATIVTPEEAAEILRDENSFQRTLEAAPRRAAAALIFAIQVNLRASPATLEMVQTLSGALSILVEDGAFEDATECLRFLLQIFEASDYRGDQTIGLESMASQLSAAGREHDVVLVRETILRERARRLGEGHVGTTVARCGLAEALWTIKDFDTAERHIAQALAADIGRDSGAHAAAAEAQLAGIAGVIALDRGDTRAALGRLDRARALLQVAGACQPTKQLALDVNYGRALVLAGRTGEAEPLLVSLVARLKATPAADAAEAAYLGRLAEALSVDLTRIGFGELARELGDALQGRDGARDTDLGAIVSEARILKEAGRLEEAARLYSQVIDALEGRSDEESRRNLAITLDNALGLFNIRRNIEAASLLSTDDGAPIGSFTENELDARTEAAFRDAFPAGHLEMGHFYGSRGVRLSMAGQVEAADSAFARCFEIVEALPRDPQVERLLMAMRHEYQIMQRKHTLPQKADEVRSQSPSDADVVAAFGSHSKERINHLLSLAEGCGFAPALEVYRRASGIIEARMATLAAAGAAAFVDRERHEARTFATAFRHHFIALSVAHQAAPEAANIEEAFRIAQRCLVSSAASAFESGFAARSHADDALNAAAVSLPAAQGALRAGEVMVVIPPAEIVSAVVVTQTDAALVSLTLTEMSLQLRNRITNRLSDDALQQSDPFSMRSISRRMIPALAPHLANASHVIFVVGGPLAEMPLSLLRWVPDVDQNENDLAAPFVVDRFAISMMPSVASFVDGRERRSPSQASRAFFGIGDPVLGATRCETLDADPLAALLNRRLGGEPSLAGLREVPETGAILDRLAATFGRRDSFVLSRSEATKARLLALNASGELARYRYICFSTHGLTAQELQVAGVRQPALLLSCATWPKVVQAGNWNRAREALLTAEDLSGLRIEADLALLTACNTAAGDGEYGASAFSGLATALIRAGARAVLVSHWSASAAATEALVRRLFDPRNHGVPRAEALRNAMIDLRDDEQGRFSQPGFWAAFVLLGDGGEPLF